MRALSLLLPLVLVTAALGAPRTEEVPGTQGMDLCCRPSFWNCYDACPKRGKAPSPDCVGRCEQVDCVAKQARCDAPGGAPETEAAEGAAREEAAKRGLESQTAEAPKRPAGDLRFDGQLTGPGTVHFEVTNLDQGNRSLAVHGLVFGMRTGVPQILRRTADYTVMPGQTTRFTLEVSDSDFRNWSRMHSRLTLAFGFADEADRNRWRYQNLLTQKDAENARRGEFQIKGAFVPAQGPR